MGVRFGFLLAVVLCYLPANGRELAPTEKRTHNPVWTVTTARCCLLYAAMSAVSKLLRAIAFPILMSPIYGENLYCANFFRIFFFRIAKPRNTAPDIVSEFGAFVQNGVYLWFVNKFYNCHQMIFEKMCHFFPFGLITAL
jgi:hypothetical protein